MLQNGALLCGASAMGALDLWLLLRRHWTWRPSHLWRCGCSVYWQPWSGSCQSQHSIRKVGVHHVMTTLADSVACGFCVACPRFAVLYKTHLGTRV